LRTKILLALTTILIVFVLTGCNMQTADKLYCLPKRSEAFSNLQAVIDEDMSGLEYNAPIAGEHQQSVQVVDLTGDGSAEYLVFAKGPDEKPLQILIFAKDGDDFYLLDRIYSNGTYFEQVEYIRMNNNPGYELVVSRRVSDQVLRSVSVYSVVNQKMEQILTTNCSQFLCHDLNDDGYWDLFILRPSEMDSGVGIAEFYSAKKGVVVRSVEAQMSESPNNVKRMIVGNLEDGAIAVFVASSVNDNAIVTDAFAVVNGKFLNICRTNSSDTVVETLRNSYVYADDIDGDGVLELPLLIPMHQNGVNNSAVDEQYLISWYSLFSTGEQMIKAYTYHNLVGRWYINLNITAIDRVFVSQLGNSYDICIWNKDFTSYEKLLTVYVLTGQNREEQAVSENRFILHRGESTIYAAKLEAVSAAYGITRDKVIRSFHLIIQDWKTGET